MKFNITQIANNLKKGICRFAPMNKPTCRNITTIMMTLILIAIGYVLISSIIRRYYNEVLQEGLDSSSSQAQTSAIQAQASADRAKTSTGTTEENVAAVKQSQTSSLNAKKTVDKSLTQTDKSSKEADNKAEETKQFTDKVAIASNKVDADAAKFKTTLEKTLDDAKKHVIDVLVEKEPVPYDKQNKTCVNTI
jgi:hypothetical protein